MIGLVALFVHVGRGHLDSHHKKFYVNVLFLCFFCLKPGCCTLQETGFALLKCLFFILSMGRGQGAGGITPNKNEGR